MVRQTASGEKYVRCVIAAPPTICQSHKVNFTSTILLNVSLFMVNFKEISLKQSGLGARARKSKLTLKW